MSIFSISNLLPSQPARRKQSPCKTLSFAIKTTFVWLLALSSFTPVSTPKVTFDFFATQSARGIAHNLGVLNPERFKVHRFDKPDKAMSDGDKNIYIGENYAKSLQNFNGAHTQKEIQGILAHEIGHSALDHSNANLPIYTEMLAEEDLAKVPQIHYRISKVIEKAADLFTVRMPLYARGLLDSLKRRLVKEVDAIAEDNLHPSYGVRIGYLTQSLCEVDPANNLDLCHRFPYQPVS